MTSLAIITPVGPGHEDAFNAMANASVVFAKRQVRNRTIFDRIEHVVIRDPRGLLGRCRARNRAMAKADWADWYFFLDADDEMHPNALSRFTADADAVFGVVSLYASPTSHTPKISKANREIASDDWDGLLNGTVAGSLSMGAYFRGEYARDLGWNEDLDAGEDWEFYLNYISRHTFKKQETVFVNIGGNWPSAGGPRGYEQLDWIACVEPLFDYWKQRGRVPPSPGERAEVAALIPQPRRK